MGQMLLAASSILYQKRRQIDGLHFETGFGSFNTIFQNYISAPGKASLNLLLRGTLYSTDGPKFTNRDPNYTASYVDKGVFFQWRGKLLCGQIQNHVGVPRLSNAHGLGHLFKQPDCLSRSSFIKGMAILVYSVFSRDIRGEKSGLDNSYLRTWYIQNEYKPGDKLNILGRVVYRETGTADDSYIYATLAGTRLIRVPIASYSNRLLGNCLPAMLLPKTYDFCRG